MRGEDVNVRALVLSVLVLGCARTPMRPCVVANPELSSAEDQRISKDDFITLHRDGCWGPCPQYSVTVYGDGRVIANGAKFVAHGGALSWQIDPTLAARLLAELVRKEVWSLQAKKMVDDARTSRLEGKLGDRVVSVRHTGDVDDELVRLIEQVSEAETRVVGCTKP